MDIDTAYNQALDYLYSFVDYSLTRNLRYSPEKFDLERMRELMQRLGNPQNDYPIIHVAGTKGKGSVSALTAAALHAEGYRTGFYTSPHLSDYCERIQVDGIQITHVELVTLVEELKPHVAVIDRLTTFELTTAMAFLLFSHRKVDAAVIEVGLGGRLDATNVLTPLVSVITSLSYDHMNVLGDTLELIAAEKAGIIKPGHPVVLAPQKESARKVVERIAAERDSEFVLVGDDYHFAAGSHSLDGQTLLVWSKGEQEQANEYIESGGRTAWQPVRLNIPLLGFHQVENAATAYVCLQTARNCGLTISEEAINRGFAAVNWPGRFEVLRRKPAVIVDSAHNRDSALKLRLAIEDYLPGQPVILIFGASEDKDVEGMFAELLPRVRVVIATQSIHPRAMDADLLVEMAHKHGVAARTVIPVETALEIALKLAGDEAAIVVAGSLFVAAAIRDAWQMRQAGGEEKKA
jgi:dihydrofolate synthase/folylpolyglutamate synthase